MGYETRYILETVDGHGYDEVGYIKGHQEKIEELSGSSGLFGEMISWFGDHEKIMKRYSKKHKDVLFKLIIEEEVIDNRYHKYFKNGKMQVCKAVIAFPEFNARKLK